MRQKTILGLSLGNCIHVAGILNFLKLAERERYNTIFLGAGVSVSRLANAIKKDNPDIVAISYRLTPEPAGKLFAELKREIKANGIKSKFIFGGTEPVAKTARNIGIFEKVFSGEELIDEVVGYLRGVHSKTIKNKHASTLIDRINQKYPYPLLRHHFGRPDMEETVKGVKEIAESEVLDILSIGPDQNAQEHFFHPERMDAKQDGAGGAPLRDPEDLRAIYKATRCGNFPLVRCYAGTTDLLKWAKMSVETIHNAWGAIPLCWYTVLDSRSERSMEDGIRENQETMKWYGSKGIPVEVNEAHQWSLRDAHDSLAVAMAFIASYNAKSVGVRHYVSQYMFNTPPATSPAMDLAKMLAKKELIEGLESRRFKVFTQIRAGLSSFSPDRDIAKGQLSASAVLSIALKPHILHVVGFSEGHHAVKAHELIESCKIIIGVLRNSVYGFPEMTIDRTVINRKNELKKEANVLIESIKRIGKNSRKDPLTDAKVLSEAIRTGLLDAPHLRGNKCARGEIVTKIIDGKCLAVDIRSGKPISESMRAKNVLTTNSTWK